MIATRSVFFFNTISRKNDGLEEAKLGGADELLFTKSGDPKNLLARFDFRSNTSVSFLLMKYCSRLFSREYRGVS